MRYRSKRRRGAGLKAKMAPRNRLVRRIGEAPRHPHRTCRFPGCERRRFTDAHHVKHWAHGGETSLENLVLLCRHHHRLLHEGGYSIERTSSGEIAFRHARGWSIPNAPCPPRSSPGKL